jgi:hypothetical protein
MSWFTETFRAFSRPFRSTAPEHVSQKNLLVSSHLHGFNDVISSENVLVESSFGKSIEEKNGERLGKGSQQCAD